MTDLTRRTLLGSATAAGAAGLLGSPSALARAGQPGRVFSQRLGRVAGISPVIDAGRPFVLAGVQWDAPQAAAIEMRARRRDGRWSRWALASVSGHEPDRPAAGSVRYGEPLWFGPVDQVQLRAAAAVNGVRLHFVAADAVGEPAGMHRFITSAPYALVDVNLPAGPGQPPIIARSAWAGRRHQPASGPYYGSIELAFVHHTENPNGYSPGQVPAMLLAIYDYHRYTRGYFDIAYNFVIDAYGRIWEARAGGVDLPVVGAHAGGYNSVSTGVAILGTFMFSQPSSAAVASLQRLLAWKLALHGIPATGKVRVEVNPSDAFYTPFAPGQRVLLPRIAGHRDGDMTSCPGTDLYHRLPVVRDTVHRQAGPLVTLTAQAAQTVVAPGTAVALGGALLGSGGAPVASAPLQIQSVTGDGLVQTVATVTTGADGAWAVTLPFARSGVLRALHATAPAAVSDLVVVGVKPVLTLALVSSSPVQVTGTVQPAKPVTVDVYKLVKGRRKLVSSRRVRAAGGTFTARPSLGKRPRGQYMIVARAAADAISLAALSAAVTVRV
jgi:hypothetical protein